MTTRSATTHDVVIIGASLAGSSAAYLLGSRGFRCALIDKQDFPRQKACGGGLSRLALPYLHALGIQPHQLTPTQAHAEFFGFRFAQPDSGLSFEAISPHARGWGVSRAHVDTLFLGRVRTHAAVEVLLKEPLRTLRKVQNIWEVSCRGVRYSAPYIIFAGGSCIPTAIAPYLIQVRPPSQRRGYSMIAATRQEIKEGFVTIVPYTSGEAYITPLGKSLVNVSMVGTHQFIQHQRPGEVTKVLSAATTGLDLETIEHVGGAGYFQCQHRSTDPGLYLAGDAQESFDPACGLGMLHAIVSGFRAAHSIETALHGRTPQMQVALAYEKAHARTACRIRRFSGMIQNLLHFYRIAPRAFGVLGPTISGRLLEGVERFTVGDFSKEFTHTCFTDFHQPPIAGKRAAETV